MKLPHTRFLLALLTLAPLFAACSQQQDGAPAEAAPPPATEVAPPASGIPPTEAAPADPAAAAPAAATPGTDPAPAPAPAEAAPPAGPPPVAGTDYVEIPNGQPYQPVAGKIEVAEVFGYPCPACAQFEPLAQAWKRRQSADVQWTPVPAAFGGHWDPFARGFYAAETAGVLDRTHEALFRAIHIERKLAPNAGVQQIADFYAGFGVDAKDFANTMQSFGVDAKLNRSRQFAVRSGVEGTPTLVVNGKYRVTGRSFEDALRITDHLVAQERAARK